MKKLLLLILAVLLIAVNNVSAADEENYRSERQYKRICERDAECGKKETSEDRQLCRANCETKAEAYFSNTYTETGEIGQEGEIKRTILPPVEKPAFLPGPTVTSNTTGNEISEFVTKKFLPSIAKRLTTIVAVTSLLALVYAGILFFIAAGVSEKIDKAKKAAMYAVMGLIIALLSFTVVQIINLLPLG